MTAPEPEAVAEMDAVLDAFRTAWAEADSVGRAGHRVEAGLAAALRTLASQHFLLWTVPRRAIEDELIEWRDARRFMMRNNGFVIAERDGTRSPIVRFGPEIGFGIGLRALADALDERAGS